MLKRHGHLVIWLIKIDCTGNILRKRGDRSLEDDFLWFTHYWAIRHGDEMFKWTTVLRTHHRWGSRSVWQFIEWSLSRATKIWYIFVSWYSRCKPCLRPRIYRPSLWLSCVDPMRQCWATRICAAANQAKRPLDYLTSLINAERRTLRL